MHLHPFGLGIVIALGAATVGAGEPPDPAAQLCHGRADCTVARRRAVEKGINGSSIVDLRIAHRSGATEDEDRCDRREYWLLKPNGAVLLARDCEVQWGADNPGPAQTELKGQEFRIKYTEFQSSDGCETVDATINLDPLALKKQVRRRGTVRRNACTHTSTIADKVAPGDGTPDHPILALHR